MKLLYWSLGVLVLGAAALAQANPAECVLLVTYDGLRWQELFGGADERMLDPELNAVKNVEAIRARFWADTPEARRERLLPFFWNVIAKEGQVFGDAERGSVCTVTNTMHFSYPGYSELLCGKADAYILSNAKRPNRNVSVLEWLNGQAAFKGKVAAFCSWDVFPYILNVDRSGLPVNAGWEGVTPSVDRDRMAVIHEVQRETPRVWEGIRFDIFTHSWAVEYIKAERPRVIYVAYGETDDWAHGGRYDLYLDSAWRTDQYLRQLWELLQSMPEYAGKTALVMTTDHGRGDSTEDWTSHRNTIPGCDRIWAAALGAGVPAKGVVRDTPATQSQIAATVAALLGKDFRKDHADAAAPLGF